VWLVKRAEISFRSFADHCVISHLHHAKKLVPFKKFSSTVDKTSALSSEFLVGLLLVQMYSFVVTQMPTSQ
jgi:hypothetical protein